MTHDDDARTTGHPGPGGWKRAVGVAVGAMVLAGGMALHAPTALAAPPPLFLAPRTTHATGPVPLSLATGDLDGDSNVDVVTTNVGSSDPSEVGTTVSVLLGDGAGGFAPRQDFTSGEEPTSVAIGDVDGDAIPDLVVTHTYGAGVVSLLVGDGAGGFAAPVVIATGAFSQSVAVIDLDGDDALDVVFSDDHVFDLEPSVVSVLLGDGTGGFGPQVDYPLGATETSLSKLVAGDLDGDGHPDVVASNRFAGEVLVFFGSASGALSAPVHHATGAAPRGLAMADVDADDALDLVVTNQDDASVSILYGDGAGDLAPSVEIATGNQPVAVAVADLNGDDVADLATAHIGPDSAWVLVGDGSGGFLPAEGVIAGSQASSLATVDVGGSAEPDLVVLNVFSSTISVLINQIGSPPTVPSAPTIGVATAGPGAATVSWTTPVTGGSPIVGYVVTPYIGIASQGPRYFLSTGTTQTVHGLTNGTTYRFRVRAINGVGVSGFSTASNRVTPRITVPGAPTSATAIEGDGEATVSWAAPTSSGGSPILGYVVTPYIGTASLGPRYFVSTATSQTIGGLTNGTAYRFRVRAWNAAGVSGFSTATNAVVPRSPI